MSQKSLWDESKHPRDELGEFAAKGEPGKATPTAAAPPPAAPPRQSLMFDTNKTLRLFEGALFESSRKKKKLPAEKQGPSLIEQIEDDLKEQHAANKKTLSGQKEMFSRLFSQAVERYYRSSALRNAIAAAAEATDLHPSPEQKEAGNYRKGKFNWRGLTIAIENPRGSIRRGKGKSGKEWQVEMRCHYGYILRNVSEADGDHVDVFVGPHPESDLVCVVDQRTPGRRFDEHKVMIGFTSVRDAKRAYLANYDSNWTGLESITAMTVQQFKNWLQRGDTKTRIAEQVGRYAKRVDESKGRWVTMHGTAVFIEGKKITKGPKNLTASQPAAPAAVSPATTSTALPPTATGKPNKPSVPTAISAPVYKNDPQRWEKKLDKFLITIPDDIWFKEWVEADEPESVLPRGRSRKAAIYEAAETAANSAEVPVEHVLKLMPDAQKYLKQEQQAREKAKADLRRVSGLTAGSLARMENQYLDHSSLKGWDTTSREFAANHPDLGFDPGGDDLPALIWEFLREGKAKYLSAFDPQVAELAALWAKPNRRSPERLPGDEDGEHRSVEARTGEAVPFSRLRTMIVEKFSRLIQKSRRLPLTRF